MDALQLRSLLIAGSIGPIELLGYPNETLQTEALQLIREVVQEQARALEGRGVDLSIYDLARRLHHEVPGIVITEPVQERLRLAGGQAKEEGLHIVEELLVELSRRPEVAGAYIICPFNRYELALTVLDAVGLPR
jgi:hypothetical protein